MKLHRRLIPLLHLAAVILALAPAKSARGQGTLIPITTRRDMVFDFAGQFLYITTSTGVVNSYNLNTQTLGPSYNLGGSLNGLDIARDNSYLLVAQNNTGVSQGSFEKVDLPSGTITNINYTRASGETGAWDVAIGSNGLALATTQFGGSGCSMSQATPCSTA
jgi:DNA-binding beta-propeller fold protein YncE